jgi:hypothetical protein
MLVAEQDVEIVEVGVLAAGIFIGPVCGDRGQLGPAEIVDQLTRKPPVPDILSEAPAGRDRNLPLEGIVFDDPAKRALDRGDR